MRSSKFFVMSLRSRWKLSIVERNFRKMVVNSLSHLSMLSGYPKGKENICEWG